MFGGAVELFEIALDQLVDGRARARVAVLRELANEAVSGVLRGAPGLRPGRDDLDQVVPALRDRVDAGVDADTEGAARKLVDAAPLAPCPGGSGP